MHWSDLSNELDAWHAERRVASLWWRDDDAAAPAPALDRLAGLAHEHDVTLGLAVIPALARPSLASWLEPVRAEVLQHGWAHHSHSTDGEKKAELGRHRAPDAMTAELSRGFAKLREVAGARFQPVLVPPWNRIDPALIPALPNAGVPRLVDLRSAPLSRAGAWPQADELSRRRGGLARWARFRRMRSGHRRGGRSSLGATGAVSGSGRADRTPDPPRRARGVDLGVHRSIPGTDAAPSGGALARPERSDARRTRRRFAPYRVLRARGAGRKQWCDIGLAGDWRERSP